MVITSITNDKIKLLRKLYEKKYRLEYGLTVAEGITLVTSILDKASIHSLYIKSGIMFNLEGYECPVYTVEDSVFDRMVETVNPSGIAALVRYSRLSMAIPQGNSLILDRISDPGNIGTIIRTAAALNYKDIYLINCTDPFSPKAIRASMGGVFRVRIYDIVYDNIKVLHQNSEIIALDTKGMSIYDYSKKGQISIIVGNEAHGVAEELINMADTILTLPMPGGTESLNAALAVGITMYIIGGKK